VDWNGNDNHHHQMMNGRMKASEPQGEGALLRK